MAVAEVDKKLLAELESMGFPSARATRALHYSGEAIDHISQHLSFISFFFLPCLVL